MGRFNGDNLFPRESSIDRRIVAGLAGAAAAAFIGFALHAALAPRDSDGDGLTDKEEEEIGTDPNKPNLNVYAKEQGIADEQLLDALRRIDDTADGRFGVDAITKTLKAYPSLLDSILAKLKTYGKDHRITEEEANSLKDLDGDGIPNWDEKTCGGDPTRADHVLAYALGKLNPDEESWQIVRKINEATNGELTPEARDFVAAASTMPEGFRNGAGLAILSSLLNDDRVDANDARLAELAGKYYQLVGSVKTLRGYLLKAAEDGFVSGDELRRSDNFTYFVKLVDSVVSGEKHATDKIGDVDYAAGLGLKLEFDKTRVGDAVAYAVGEYAVAVNDLRLPESYDGVVLLVDAAGRGGWDAVGFKPLVYEGKYGRVVFEPNVPREVWTLAAVLEKLKEEGVGVGDGELLGLRERVFDVNVSVYDLERGVRFYEEHFGRSLPLGDGRVVDVIARQHVLMNDARRYDFYQADVPWWDAAALKELMAVEGEDVVRQKLMLLFGVPQRKLRYK